MNLCLWQVHALLDRSLTVFLWSIPWNTTLLLVTFTTWIHHFHQPFPPLELLYALVFSLLLSLLSLSSLISSTPPLVPTSPCSCLHLWCWSQIWYWVSEDLLWNLLSCTVLTCEQACFYSCRHAGQHPDELNFHSTNMTEWIRINTYNAAKQRSERFSVQK